MFECHHLQGLYISHHPCCGGLSPMCLVMPRSLDFFPLIHMHKCVLRICQCGSMASIDTRLMPSSRPSFLPPPGRLTPWRWTQICTPWKAPTGSWTSEIPAGALSARSTRPPYSEAGSPQLILYSPAHCPPQTTSSLQPCIQFCIHSHTYMQARCLLTVMVKHPSGLPTPTPSSDLPNDPYQPLFPP